MRTNGMPNETAFASSHRQKKTWLTVLAVLAAVVAFATVAALTMPASAMTGQDTATPETAATAETAATPAPTEASESVQAQEQAQADTAALPTGVQAPDGYTDKRTVRDEENGFAVTVYAPEGVIPADAKLCATLLPTDSEEYKQAGEQLAEQTDLLPAPAPSNEATALSLDGETDGAEAGETPSVGYAALDIHFEDADGNEIEPNGEVFVAIDAAGLIPEDADPESVTVQHHAKTPAEAEANDAEPQETPKIKVETVADTAPAEEGVEGAVAVTTPDAATETTTDDATVTAPEGKPETEVQAAFEVDGFSTFTITWNIGRYYNPSVTVHYVDQSGNEIQGKQTAKVTASNNQWVNLGNYADEIEGYTYQGAHLNSYNGTEAKWVKYDSDRNSLWRYSNNENRPNNGNGQSWQLYYGNYNIYLVYNKEIETVDTVDSTAEGVHMYMFNYANNRRQFNGGEYTEGRRTGDVKEGMTTRTTTNGWPSLTGDYDTPQQSLSWLFGNSASAFEVSDSHAVNHLFLQSKYDEDGTFYYSAFENFATLANDDNSDFTVYNALGSPEGGDPYYFQRGNFMPYNMLDTSNVISHNRYTAEGEALQEGDPGYNDPIYGLQGNNDFHFGMYIWADFYQPQDGKVEPNDNDGDGQPDGDPKDMIFEFTGDDDMWVYIDGVLVLDLGGIHDAQSGTINFATGEVRYTDTTIDQDHTDRPNTPEWHSTTIKAQYEAARRESRVDWNDNTFADGSNHRIQIFYMERGEGASNLKISFNLKTIPDGQLAVHKEVENYYAPQLADVTYTMQVKVNNKVYANKRYTIQGTSITGTTDENGCLTLHNDQTAVFPDLTVNDKVTVQEVGTSDTPEGSAIDSKYDMSCTVTDSAGDQIPGSSVVNGVASAAMPGYGSVVVNVTNKATFTRPLKLVKNFDGTEGNAAPDGFEATYTLYEVEADGNLKVPAVGSIRYSDMTRADDGKSGSYIFWLETDKTYTIKESFDGDGDNKAETDDMKWNGFTVTTNDPVGGTQAGDGIVYLDEDDATQGDNIDTITMTNRYGKPTVSLTIIKNIYGLDDDAAEALVNGENGESGLRFDVDGFTQSKYLVNDEKGVQSGYPEGHNNWNDWGDRTFSVSDTLDDEGFDVNGDWKDKITTPGGESIAEDEGKYYTNISMTKVTPSQGDSYYQYKVTITDMPVNVWFRVWEMHPDLDGYSLSSTVAEYLTQATGEDKLDNYLTTKEVMEQTSNRGDHGGRTTAFQLTKDTTVEFTNTYTAWPDITVTKVDSTNSNIKLANAEFYVTKTTGTGTDEKTVYYHYEDTNKKTTWVEANSDKSNVTKLTSNQEGIFTIHGLEDGQYTLVEVKAPDGYQLPTTNFEFSVIDGHVNYKNVNEGTNVTVTNTTGTALPETGGAGTNFLAIGGLLLMAAAVGGGCVLRRRRGKEAG